MQTKRIYSTCCTQHTDRGRRSRSTVDTRRLLGVHSEQIRKMDTRWVFSSDKRAVRETCGAVRAATTTYRFSRHVVVDVDRLGDALTSANGEFTRDEGTDEVPWATEVDATCRDSSCLLIAWSPESSSNLGQSKRAVVPGNQRRHPPCRGYRPPRMAQS